MKILVAAGGEESLRPILDALYRNGFDADSVSSAEDAERLADEQRHDLVLLSTRLPGGDGLGVCQRIKARCEHFLPVILIAPEGDDRGAVAGLESGADEYLSAPIANHEFLARLRALLRIRNLHDQVRRLSSVREQVVYTVSHDFRTPLVGIRGAVQNLLAGLVGPLAREQREYLELVEQATQRLFDLTDEMTRRAKGRRGKGPASRGAVDLRRAVETAAAGLRAELVRRKMRLDIAADPETPPAWGDQEQLVQVMANLLDNAVKLSPAGSQIHVEIREDVNRRGGSHVHAIVMDQGPGIARSDFERIFHRFEQVGAPEWSEGGGSGMGLAICRETVEGHGGKIWVESKPGAGAWFHVLLPAAAPVRGAV